MYKSIYQIRTDNFRALLVNRFKNNRADFSEATGISVLRLSRYLGKEQKKIGDDMSRAIEQKLKLPEYWFDMPHFDEPTETQFYEKYTILNGLDVKACCGAGNYIEFEEITGAYAFRTDWLRRSGLSPENLEVIRALGNSMYPLIKDGDILLIDRSQTVPSPATNNIYVVYYDGMVMVKRVRVTRNKIILEADNEDKKEFRDIEIIQDGQDQVASTLKIIGRVVWQGGSL